MLLAIDIGNSSTSFGLFRKGELAKVRHTKTDRLRSVPNCARFVKAFLGKTGITRLKGIIISSVIPALNSVYRQACVSTLRINPVFVSHKLPLEIKIKYKNPSQVGADRIANAVAGYKLYGGPLIIVDLGTATTFEVVSAKGEFLGGAIAPGIMIAAESLSKKTAQLFVPLLKKPARAIGRSTEENLLSGIIYGAAGQIDFIVEEIERELGKKCKVIGTGGFAPLVWKVSRRIRKLELTLTLKGLFHIFSSLQGRGKIK